ncbi:unnamed protein product, partial [Ectocarpus fasciculatus]
PLVRDQHDIVLKVFLQALLNVLPLETMGAVDFRQLRVSYEAHLALVKLNVAPDLLFVVFDGQARRNSMARLRVTVSGTNATFDYTPAAVLNGSIDGDTVISRVDL